MLETASKGLFCQLITIPLFKEHKILTQVAGHGSHTIKLIPPLIITDEDCDWIVRAFDDVIADSHRVGRGLVARQDAGRARDARERLSAPDSRNDSIGSWTAPIAPVARRASPLLSAAFRCDGGVNDARSLVREERNRERGPAGRRGRDAAARPGRGAHQAEDLRRQSVGREEPRRHDAQDRVSARDPAQRRRRRSSTRSATGVAQSRVGERVWTWNGQWKRPFGTAAEYITLPEIQAVKLPDAISFEAGACFGIPALTAWHAVDIAGTAKGMTLLIAGGAGAVAHYAIQFAKARGATVITTVSSPEKAKLAREAGADHTIDYKTEDVGARVMALTKGGVDAVIELDLTANAALLPSVLRPHGTLVVYGTGPQVQFPGSFCLVNNITVKFMIVYELTAESARARGRRHHPHAGSEHADPQCRGDLSARRDRRGARGGGAGQGRRQRGGGDFLMRTGSYGGSGAAAREARSTRRNLPTAAQYAFAALASAIEPYCAAMRGTASSRRDACPRARTAAGRDRDRPPAW